MQATLSFQASATRASVRPARKSVCVKAVAKPEVWPIAQWEAR